MKTPAPVQTTTSVSPEAQKLDSLWLAYWNKWGIWILVGIVVVILFATADWTAFLRGMWDSLTEKDKQGQGLSWAGVTGMILGMLLGSVLFLGPLILVMMGLGNLYYKVFHERVFKENKLSYTVLYILVLILAWNLLSDGLAQFKVYNTGDAIQDYKLNDLLGSVLASLLLICLIVFGFIKDFRKHHKQRATLLQQKTQAELDALKAQVNPHFLFNTLNNIYGTAMAEDSPRTAESIHQLSGIVRYVMEEANSTRTSVQRELRFIDDYVELQRMRIPRLDNIRIFVETFWDEQPAEVMPLLLNPLIENAFKYGVSMQHPCFVEIRLRIEDGVLTFSTRNSLVPRTRLEKSTGLGLKNVQKRLQLGYAGRHEFRQTETDGVFEVSLTINLHPS